jgi:hypothetical protein
MTRTTNARIAGYTFLIYIAFGAASVTSFGRASRGEGTGAKLASIEQHATVVRVGILLDLVQCFSALVLAVTLYSITRQQDRDLALMGMLCRAGEGVLGATGLPQTVGLLSLASATGATAPDTAAAHVLAAYFLRGSVLVTATFFAVGSLFFCWLILRGRMIPTWMAWLGVISSILLVVGLPLMFAGFLAGPMAALLWLPMLVFEVTFAFWLIIKGVATQATAP